MDKVARLGAADRRELFQETGARRGMSPAIAEKDFWVCWVLKRLFEDPELRGRMVFKGGTTLSKVYGLIERFSEDIDLVLDWRLLGYGPEIEDQKSNTKRDSFNKQAKKKAAEYIGGPLMERLTQTLAGLRIALDAADTERHTISVSYPAAFREAYLRPEVQLEFGPLSSMVPSSPREIRPYAADVFPHVFADPICTVTAIDAERTFWEKATILHQQAHRAGIMPGRYSRHYHDLYKLAGSALGRYAAGNTAMLAEVVAFKRQFYPSAWASYETAVPGRLRLLPRPDQVTALKQDYAAMRFMIFGELASFEEILRGLGELEVEINRPSGLEQTARASGMK